MGEVTEDMIRQADEHLARLQKEKPGYMQRIKDRRILLDSMPEDFSARVRCVIDHKGSVRFIDSEHPGFTSGMMISYSPEAFPESLRHFDIGDVFTAMFNFKSKIAYTDVQRV